MVFFSSTNPRTLASSPSRAPNSIGVSGDHAQRKPAARFDLLESINRGGLAVFLLVRICSFSPACPHRRSNKTGERPNRSHQSVDGNYVCIRLSGDDGAECIFVCIVYGSSMVDQ